MSTFGSLCSASIDAMKLSALLEHAEAAVDRVAHQRADREHGVEPFRGRGIERMEFQAAAFRRVEQHAAESARQRDRAKPAAGRRAGMDEQFGDLDRIVERVGADDAGFAGDGIERLDAAGERPGMRERGAAAGFRLPELDGDNRFAGSARQPAGGLEFRDVRNRLDIDDDDLDLGLTGEERDIVGDRQAGLVAAGDQISGRRCRVPAAPGWSRSSCRRSGRPAPPGRDEPSAADPR